MSKYTGPMHVPNKRIKKLEGAPKRAMSSFLSFSQLMRSEIRLQYPNLKNTDVSSVLAQKWHEASDEAKRPHIERELKDREKYHKDMARWKAEESERVAANKAQTAADLIVSEDAAKFQASLQYATTSQLATPSLWAAMIDVNESTDFGSNSPLFDESMDGFWDTDGDGENNETNGQLNLAPVVKSTQLTLPIAYAGDSTQLVDAGSKGHRLIKRAKDRKASETAFQLQSVAQSSAIPTARQVEVQQRRQQQQQQYQMYQLHILNQKQKTDQCKDDFDGLHGTSDDEAKSKGRNTEGFRGPRGISSAVSIVEGGRLHSQSQANQRLSNQEVHTKFQNSTYQGAQRQPVSRPHDWPPGLFGLMSGATPSLPKYPNYSGSFSNNVSDRFYYEPQPATQAISTTSQPFLGSRSNSNDALSTMMKSTSSQPNRSYQFEEQDQLSVMQTLMAVHRATASKAGDCETIRSLDRIQMAQYGQGYDHGGFQRMEGKISIPTKVDDRSLLPQYRNNTLNDTPSKCAPLSVQQQERQNQTERQQLTDRQSKQMQDMLLLQEREQVEQRQEHSYSMVSASNESSSSSSEDEEAFHRNIAPFPTTSK